MIYRNAIVLVTLAVSTNAFWFGGEQKIEPQPTVKQVPLGFFRAFTYQPFPFNPQAPNQYLSYSGGKPYPPSYSYSKTVPGPSGPQSSMYGPPPHSIPQPPNTPSAPTTVPPTKETRDSSQTSSQPASVSPTTSTTGTQSQSVYDVPASSVPSVFSPNYNSAPIRPVPPYVPEPVNLQYITNVTPVPLQQVQFVPCMCPVAVSISTGISNSINPEMIANKRSDDIQMSADYRDVSIGEQSLTEER